MFSNYALTTHTHTYGINDITNLQTELNNRSLTTHAHNEFGNNLTLRTTTSNSRLRVTPNDGAATAESMVYFQHHYNATCRIGTVGPNSATRPLELSTGWGNNFGVVVRQYEGQNQWTTIRNELTLLNAAGNTIIPRDLTVNGNRINTNLTNQLNNRSLTTHTHTFGINDITNLQTELNNRALTAHSHTFAIKDIIGLQNELNKYALTNHTHTDLPNILILRK